MKTTITWAVVLSGLILSGTPVRSQEFWYVPHVEESRTPVEVQLQGKDLALPGFGIASTRSTIIKRLEFALDHKWLTASQDQQFCNDLKAITDKEQSLRDADGNLSFKARAELARQLTDLNNKFEELVLVKEQSSPGIQGLLARQSNMIQRVNQAFADGKLSARHAYQMKADIRAVASDEPNQEFSDEQSRQIAGRLNELNIALDKDLHGPSSVAASPDAIPK